MSLRNVGCVVLVAAGLCVSASAVAKTPPERVAELGGPKYTCMGAERAGSPGGVAEYTGKWLDQVPGLKPGEYAPGPYAAEKPLFTIDSASAARYADKLTEGEKALFKAYPENFRIPVYPSHRDFRTPDWACDVVKKNAPDAEVKDDGLSATGTTGNISFPFPQSGLEAIWNLIQTYVVWSSQITQDEAAVYDNGNISWGRERSLYRVDMARPDVRADKLVGISTYDTTETLLPARNKGGLQSAVSFASYVNGSTQAWIYNPGTRRVRQAPEVGFDYPLPPFNLIGVDDVNIFNSSPARFDWTIVGKKELYVPVDGFKLDDPALKYSDMLKKGGLNPDYMRYELRRVWVVQGTLKQGLRHQYSKRVLYIDEDTWLPVLADNYDARGVLWRISMQNLRYFPEGMAFRPTVASYTDLIGHDYVVYYLTNEGGPSSWWKINQPIADDKFGPKALAGAGR